MLGAATVETVSCPRLPYPQGAGRRTEAFFDGRGWVTQKSSTSDRHAAMSSCIHAVRPCTSQPGERRWKTVTCENLDCKWLQFIFIWKRCRFDFESSQCWKKVNQFCVCFFYNVFSAYHVNVKWCQVRGHHAGTSQRSSKAADHRVLLRFVSWIFWSFCMSLLRGMFFLTFHFIQSWLHSFLKCVSKPIKQAKHTTLSMNVWFFVFATLCAVQGQRLIVDPRLDKKGRHRAAKWRETVRFRKEGKSPTEVGWPMKTDVWIWGRGEVSGLWICVVNFVKWRKWRNRDMQWIWNE